MDLSVLDVRGLFLKRRAEPTQTAETKAGHPL